MISVKFETLGENVTIPHRQSHEAAGYDVHAYIPEPFTIRKGEIAAVATGLRVEVPSGYLLSVRPRSGLSFKHGVTCVNSPGTIDADYRGEVKILLINLGPKDYTIEPGERIAQFLLEKSYAIEWQRADLSESQRGEAGFGSTGKT